MHIIICLYGLQYISHHTLRTYMNIGQMRPVLTLYVKFYITQISKFNLCYLSFWFTIQITLQTQGIRGHRQNVSSVNALCKILRYTKMHIIICLSDLQYHHTTHSEHIHEHRQKVSSGDGPFFFKPLIDASFWGSLHWMHTDGSCPNTGAHIQVPYCTL